MTNSKKIVTIIVCLMSAAVMQGCEKISLLFNTNADKIAPSQDNTQQDNTQQDNTQQEEDKNNNQENKEPNKPQDNQDAVDETGKNEAIGKLKNLLTNACKNNLKDREIKNIEVVKFFENGDIYLNVESREDIFLVEDLVVVSTNKNFENVQSWKDFKNKVDEIEPRGLVVSVESNIMNNVDYESYKFLVQSIVSRAHMEKGELITINNFSHKLDGKYYSRALFFEDGSVKTFEITVDETLVDEENYLNSCIEAFNQSRGTAVYKIREKEQKEMLLNGEEFELSFNVAEENSLLKSGIDIQKNNNTGLYEINFNKQEEFSI